MAEVGETNRIESSLSGVRGETRKEERESEGAIIRERGVGWTVDSSFRSWALREPVRWSVSYYKRFGSEREAPETPWSSDMCFLSVQSSKSMLKTSACWCSLGSKSSELMGELEIKIERLPGLDEKMACWTYFSSDGWEAFEVKWLASLGCLFSLSLRMCSLMALGSDFCYFLCGAF